MTATATPLAIGLGFLFDSLLDLLEALVPLLAWCWAGWRWGLEVGL